MSILGQGDAMQEPGDAEKIGIGPPQRPEYLRPIYANFANVNHTPWDFRIVFGLVKAPDPGQEEEVKRRGFLEPEAVAEVILPANLMVGFMTALKQNWDRYLEAFGVPGMDMGQGQEE